MTIEQEEILTEYFESKGMTRGDAQGKLEAMSEEEQEALYKTLCS